MVLKVGKKKTLKEGRLKCHAAKVDRGDMPGDSTPRGTVLDQMAR